MTEAHLISTTGKIAGRVQPFSLGDEVWLTDEALLLVRHRSASRRALVGMSVMSSPVVLGGMTAGVLGAVLLGGLGGFVNWRLAEHGRDEPGESSAAWEGHLRHNPLLVKVVLRDVTAAAFKGKISIRLKVKDRYGVVTEISWQRNPKTDSLVRDALGGVLYR